MSPPYSADAVDPAPLPRRSPWQFGLRANLMIVAIVALAFSILKDQNQIGWLRPRITALEPLAHELHINDPAQFAIVRLAKMWLGENQWDVYLPPGARYRINIATREIKINAMTAASHEAIIAAGRHLVALEETQDEAKNYHLKVTVDGKTMLEPVEPDSWHKSWSSIGGSQSPISQQVPADQILKLFHLRRLSQAENAAKTLGDTGETGIFLWIDRIR